MAILINNKSPEFYGIDRISLSSNSLIESVLSMTVNVQGYDEDTALDHREPVTLTIDGQQMFTGKVVERPRMLTGESESYTYEVADAWHDLDRIIYQQSRDYISVDGDDVVTDVSELIGEVFWEADDNLGARITDVIEFAIHCGLDAEVGIIEDGLRWYRSGYKDQTCGEIIRDMMRLMPDHLFWLDVRQSPPTFNLMKRVNLPKVSYDINEGNVILSNNITSLDKDMVEQVIIKYEKTYTVDDDTKTRIIVDKAPSNATGCGMNVVMESVTLRGANAQFEYVPITTRPIPQADEEIDIIKEWYVDHIPELAKIAKDFTKEIVLPLIKVADTDIPLAGVKKHVIRIIDDEVERPEPINPNSTILEKSLDLTDYPNELVDGVIPDWIRKHHIPLEMQVTLGIDADFNPNANELASRLYDAFTQLRKNDGQNEFFYDKKKFEDNYYLTALATIIVRGTNARTKVYSRTVALDAGETPPTGIAQLLLDELSQVRHVGSLELIGEEIDQLPMVGNGLNLTGGRSEWVDMNEIIQSINYDITEGVTSLTFGVPELLGANDMVDRLRAARKNVYFQGRTDEANDGVGGQQGTVINQSTFAPEQTSKDIPFKLQLFYDGESYAWEVGAKGSKVMNGLNGDAIDLSGAGFNEDNEVSETKYIVLQADIDSGLSHSNWILTAVDKADSKEIGTIGDPATQNKARLLIGVIEFEDGIAKAKQSVKTAQMLEFKFINGMAVRAFSSQVESEDE